MSIPTIELSSYDMGDVTEADYNLWVSYVADHIDEACGFEVAVEQRRFGAAGSDRITHATDAQRETIAEAVAAMWDAAEWDQAKGATESQIAAIRARRVDDTARAMMAEGVTLTHEQADDLGDEAMGWLSSRLGLTVTETDSGVECTPQAAV